MDHLRNQGQFWFRREIIISLIAVFSFLAVIPIVTYLVFANSLQSKESIMNRNDTGVILLDRNNKPFFSFYQAKYKQFVALSQIPVSMQQAVIAVEDKGFYNHPGFSFTSIIRSLIDDVLRRDTSYGGSTITQQLVKNSLLSPQKSFLRKYEEIVLAQEIERRYSKNEILEMYLNSVYFGEGTFGIEEAAERYFHEKAQNLDTAQSAILSGLLPSPSELSPISGDFAASKERQKLVLQKMAEQGYISSAQGQAAENETLTFASNNENINTEAPHFALMVRDALIQKYGEENISRSGFKVKTTVDLDLEQYAESVVKDQVAKLLPNHATNGAAVVIDPKTGEILALVGSKDWYDEKFGKVNMAITPRQPGSSFKPVVYSYALQNRIITPSTILHDAPTTFLGGYKPLDFDRKFRGQLLPRRALANSLNIPAVEVMQKVGVANALEWAKTLGISTLSDPSNYGLSLVLGAGEVKLTELTEVYATLADGGNYNEVTSILSIQDKSGQDIYDYTPHPQQVVDPDVAYILSSFLSDNNARAEEFGNLLTISRPAAVKTGTTEDFRGALTFGYTPSITVGVWVGNNDNSPMDNIAGSLGAAPIWKLLMGKTLAGTPVETFPKPSDLISEYICRDNGLLARNATSSAYLEFYLKGTEPTRDCSSGPAIAPFPFPSSAPSSQPQPQPLTQGSQHPQDKPRHRH